MILKITNDFNMILNENDFIIQSESIKIRKE